MIIVSMLLGIMPYMASGQEREKLRLGVLGFTVAEGSEIDPQDVSTVQDIVINSFINSQRFVILEREMLEQLKGETENQKEESFINSISSLAEQGRLVGAEYLLLGKVSKISVEEFTSKAGVRSFIAYVTVTIRIVNVESGEIDGSSTITVQPNLIDRKLLKAATRGAALRKIEKPVNKGVNKFIQDYVPIEIRLGKIIETKKGKVSSLYVLAGEKQGVRVGTKVEIIKVDFEDFGDGEKTKIETVIGLGKVSESKGAKISVCSISKGGDKLLASINGGDDLILKTIN